MVSAGITNSSLQILDSDHISSHRHGNLTNRGVYLVYLHSPHGLQSSYHRHCYHRGIPLYEVP